MRGKVFNDFEALQGCANGVGGLHAGAVPVETQDDFSGAGMVLQIRLQGRGQLHRFAISGALDAADRQAGGLSPVAAPELQQRQIGQGVNGAFKGADCVPSAAGGNKESMALVAACDFPHKGGPGQGTAQGCVFWGIRMGAPK